MRKSIPTFLVLLAAAGCSADQWKRSTYEALNQKECESRTGVPGCAEKKPTYDDYARERDKALERDGSADRP